MAASSLEQKLSRLEAKLKQENREARRRIDLNLDISPQRPRPIIVITLSPAPAPSQRAALQLPLANDGGSRSPSSESSPQHPTPPTRPRHMLGLPSTLFTPRSMESIEIDQKLQEIMKQTGYLTIGGQRYQAEINDLENLGEMGSGTCGQVWKMRFRKTGHIIAVKQMRRSGNKEENKRILMDLDVVLKSHDCPYIVQCFGTFITNTDVFIAMELMGTCAEKLKKRMQGPIPERILGKMTVAIVKALYYLKEKHGVIHRDVKPSNILLDERGQIKLCDFGISGRLVDSKAKTRSAGCAAYMAPERIDPPDPTKPDYDIRADVWSLGISLVELATGQFPYKNCKTDFEVLTKVLQEEPPLLPGHMGFSGDFQSFVKDCLTKDHRKRPPQIMASRKAGTRGKAAATKQAQRGSSNVFSMFEQAQIQEFKEAFSCIDQNRDGIICKSDLKETYSQLGRVSVPEEELDAMLQEGKGPINFTVFLTLFGEKLNGTDPEEAILSAFRMFDPSGQGVVNKEEFKQLLMTQADKFSPAEVEQLFALTPMDLAGNIDYKSLCYIITHGDEKEE